MGRRHSLRQFLSAVEGVAWALRVTWGGSVSNSISSGVVLQPWWYVGVSLVITYAGATPTAQKQW